MIPGGICIFICALVFNDCNTWEPLCQGGFCPASEQGSGFLAQLKSGSQSLCFNKDQDLLKSVKKKTNTKTLMGFR